MLHAAPCHSITSAGDAVPILLSTPLPSDAALATPYATPAAIFLACTSTRVLLHLPFHPPRTDAARSHTHKPLPSWPNLRSILWSIPYRNTKRNRVLQNCSTATVRNHLTYLHHSLQRPYRPSSPLSKTPNMDHNQAILHSTSTFHIHSPLSHSRHPHPTLCVPKAHTTPCHWGQSTSVAIRQPVSPPVGYLAFRSGSHTD
jgi:hypothetical protein